MKNRHLARCAPRVPIQETKMIELPLQASNERALFRYMSHRIATRLCSFVNAVDDSERRHGASVLANTILLPNASIVVAGTNCRAPLYDRESKEVAALTGFDVILLRFDPDEGTLFDLFLTRMRGVLRNYVAWHPSDTGQWLVPDREDGPSLLIAPSGIKFTTETVRPAKDLRLPALNRIKSAPLLKGAN